MAGELARHGFVVGRNLKIEPHLGERLLDLAREAVETQPDLIFAGGLPAARAAHDITKTVPIVTIADFLQEEGLVATLARPGGNLSGVTGAADISLKRLELLHELVPAARHVVLLREPAFYAKGGRQIAALFSAAHTLGIAIEIVDIRRPEEIAGAVHQARGGGAEAIGVLDSAMFFEKVDILAATAIDARMPLMCLYPEMAQAGCLASYGQPLAEVFRRAGLQVARVLEGARIAELPVEQPTRYELVINLKTAKTLGFTIPPALLARADEVVE
jgi:putative ABC transport system substrate-binding protein